MIKGDKRKNEILSTAETLFCRKGYRNTSINDILDALNISKGSFYHHFPCKETLLEKLCEKHAEEQYECMLYKLEAEKDPLKRLDIVFSGMIPFDMENLHFLLMMFPVLDIPEGRNVLDCWTGKICSVFSAAAENEVITLRESGIIYPPRENGAVQVCIDIVNHLWTCMAKEIVSKVRKNIGPDMAHCIEMIELYRHILERVLEAPWGTIKLMDAEELDLLISHFVYQMQV